jgi:ApaG protein
MNLCGNDIDLSREFERDFDIDIINNKEYYQNEEHGILVEVIPRYMPKVSNPEDGLYIFMYTIRVINNSELPIGVVNRYLKTKDGKGRKCDLFESASLIGEPTVVGPGLTFEYTTLCS